MYFVYFKTYDCFVLTLVLSFLITVNPQQYTFYSQIGELTICIEDHLSKDSRLKISSSSVGNVSRIVAKRFGSKSFNKQQFTQAVENIYFFIKTTKSIFFINQNVPKQLRSSIREALKDCIKKKNVPRFVHEPQDLADLLDYVLVDWPVPLNEMIRTRDGRSTLRLYAFSAGIKLMSALRNFTMDYDAFHRDLLKIWMLRAQNFYDARNQGVPYIRHRFTTDADRMSSILPLGDIHIIDDTNVLLSRRSENFSYRNSIFDVPNYNEVLKIVGGRYYRRNNSNSSLSQLSAAEFYLGSHIVQCYRIIIFILELQLRGISTDEDDIYDGTIPFSVVPLHIQRIAWNGEEYKDYLWTWREHLQKFSSGEVNKCFTKEDLIMQLSLMIVQSSSKNILSSTTTTTTTSTTTTTESPGYDKVSEKGGIRDRDCGKYFLPNKRFKATLPDQEQHTCQTSSNGNHYGYIIYHDDSKKPNKLDSSMHSKILTGLCFVIQGISS